MSPVFVGAQDLLITEFMAQRSIDHLDDDGDPSDFIEIYNNGPTDVELGGYFLSDGCTNRLKWSFPAGVVIDSGNFLVVWASEKDRRDPCCDLHTNFRFDGAGGECVTLSDPFGDQIHTDNFYPAQPLGYSYGIPMSGAELSLVAPGAPCIVTIPSASNPISGTGWTLPGYNDSAWVIGTTGVGYDTTPDYHPMIELDLALAMPMRDVNPSCYIRIPFHIDDPDEITGFEFAMKYDDGFIAYINGTRVTSRKAPEDPHSGSVAAVFQPDANAFDFEVASFDEGTPVLQVGENILAIHGLNDAVSSTDFLADPRLSGFTAGALERNERHFFSTPTPGSPNAPGAPGISASPVFSELSGAYSPGLSIDLSMAVPVGGTEIRFTLDGSDPTATSTLYTDPIDVDSEVVITARAFQLGLLPSPPISEHYLILGSDVVNFSSTIPVAICSTLGSTLTNQCSSGPYTEGRFFLFTTGDDDRARTTDVPHFEHRVGYRRRGNPAVTCRRPKFFFNLETRDREGKDDDEQFLDFATHSDYAMWGPYQFDRTFMRNSLAYWMSREVGRWAPRTEFVELFFHTPGDEELTMASYLGVYVLMERNERGVGRIDVNRLDSGDNAQPDISGGYILQRDRTKTGDVSISAGGYNNLVFESPSNPTPAQASYIRGIVNFAIASFSPDIATQDDSDLFDVGSVLDHHILMWYPKNVDAFRFSAYFYKPRNGLLTFGQVWDYDRSMGVADDGRAASPTGFHNDPVSDGGSRYFEHPGPPGDAGTQGNWFGILFDNEPPLGQSPWALAYRARWFELRAGPLSTDNINGQIDAWAAVLTEPAVRNFNRFSAVSPRFGSFQGEVNHLKTWLQTRAEWIDDQFDVIIILPPTFSHPGGAVPSGFELELSSVQGTIFYTLNGPDPLTESGLTSAEAIVYDNPIPIAENTRVRARVRVGSDWSELAEAGYDTSEISLVVTEIMYNPLGLPGDGFGKSLYEFIEFQNVAGVTTDLQGVTLADPFFDFTNSAVTSLAAGEHVVVVRNMDAFSERYGTDGILIAGVYSNSLGNAVENIAVRAASGNAFIDFNYQSSWEPTTNGQGRSLVIQSAESPPNLASSWRPSHEVGGSPGRADTSMSGDQRLQGDLNGNGVREISDVTAILFSLVGLLPVTPCLTVEANTALQDVDGDSVLTVNDAVYLLRYLFLAGPPPARGAGCTSIQDCPNTCL
jgi:hypothetical protein